LLLHTSSSKSVYWLAEAKKVTVVRLLSAEQPHIDATAGASLARAGDSG
jgi:hypothetical protein